MSSNREEEPPATRCYDGPPAPVSQSRSEGRRRSPRTPRDRDQWSALGVRCSFRGFRTTKVQETKREKIRVFPVSGRKLTIIWLRRFTCDKRHTGLYVSQVLNVETGELLATIPDRDLRALSRHPGPPRPRQAHARPLPLGQVVRHRPHRGPPPGPAERAGAGSSVYPSDVPHQLSAAGARRAPRRLKAFIEWLPEVLAFHGQGGISNDRLDGSNNKVGTS